MANRAVLRSVVLWAAIGSLAVALACGPKPPTPEEMSQLETTQKGAVAAEQQLQQKKQEREQLEAQLKEKKAERDKLQRELEAVRAKAERAKPAR